MNEVEISRIAAAISDLRPDWPASSIRSLLNRPELRNRPRRDVAVALAWIACETETNTPARVIEPGPWWRAASVETAGLPPRPPSNATACPIHPGGHRDNCSGCASDRLAARDEPEPTPATGCPRCHALAHGTRPRPCRNHQPTGAA